jgi:hypothetical protein
MGAKASKAKQAKDRQGKLEKVEAQLDAARQLVGGQRHQPKLQLAAVRRSGADPPGLQLTAPACRSRARGSIRHSRRRATSCCSSSRTRRSATRRAARTFCRASACSCAAGCGSWCAAPTARASRRSCARSRARCRWWPARGAQMRSGCGSASSRRIWRRSCLRRARPSSTLLAPRPPPQARAHPLLLGSTCSFSSTSYTPSLASTSSFSSTAASSTFDLRLRSLFRHRHHRPYPSAQVRSGQGARGRLPHRRRAVQEGDG